MAKFSEERDEAWLDPSVNNKRNEWDSNFKQLLNEKFTALEPGVVAFPWVVKV
jgi:hypothetical protein